MKEKFIIEMKKEKEFIAEIENELKNEKLDSIKVEARITRYLEFDNVKELFIGYNNEDNGQSLGLVIIERYNLSEKGELCDKSYRLDTVPYYNAEQNFYKFLNDRRVFERLIKEMVELMGRVDKNTSTVEFGFYCDIDSIKASLLQAMESEAEDKLKILSKDRFFKIEEAIKEAYKGGKE